MEERLPEPGCRRWVTSLAPRFCSVWFVWFARDGIFAQFAPDDMMNLARTIAGFAGTIVRCVRTMVTTQEAFTRSRDVEPTPNFCARCLPLAAGIQDYRCRRRDEKRSRKEARKLMTSLRFPIRRREPRAERWQV